MRNACNRPTNTIDNLEDDIATKSRTAKIWMNYVKCVSVIRLFMRAERTGDWNLHLYYFTIRRTERFWGGNFSDQTIEQGLMRLLKTSGGMTHGRGITDSSLIEMGPCFATQHSHLRGPPSVHECPHEYVRLAQGPAGQ